MASGRDFAGYAGDPPDPKWPNGARLAIVVVLNIEEGAEPEIAAGDERTETALTDAIAGEVPPGKRDFVAETLFEYGSRAGFWRLHRFFAAHALPATMSVCARALERNPPIAAAIRATGYDICCHGLRFERHVLMDEQHERATIERALASLESTLGTRPAGWQSRYSPSERTRALLVERGDMLYDADSYADDLPYWERVNGRAHLIVPHTFTHNDNRYFSGNIAHADDFFAHLRAGFSVLYDESHALPRMMTISLHNRVSGQPSRFDAVRRFIDFAGGHEGVWFASRGEIARHWHRHHHPDGAHA